MAHTKSLGSTKLGRDSISKRLGVKITDGQSARTGQIIVRQRGTHYVPGVGVLRAGDDTLYAKVAGIVRFSSKRKINFDRTKKTVTMVSVQPLPSR